MSLKRDEIANPQSCLNKAADDEPIFVLRANDPVAARIVRQWAYEYTEQKLDESVSCTLTNAQLAKAQEARGLANQMDAWRFDQGPTPWPRPARAHYQVPMSGKRQDGIFGRCACGVLWPCKLATSEPV